MSIQDENDRREYYRIEDTIALEFTPLTSAPTTTTDGLHNSSALFSLISDLHTLEYESQHLLRHIAEKDRSLANYLKTINKRIDLLGQAVAHSALKDLGAPRKVTISEGGISFSHPSAAIVGERAALKMLLLPQALGLMLQGVVVHCQAQADQHYEIGLEFDSLSESQRQLLARHILQRQAHERRQSRLASTNP